MISDGTGHTGHAIEFVGKRFRQDPPEWSFHDQIDTLHVVEHLVLLEVHLVTAGARDDTDVIKQLRWSAVGRQVNEGTIPAQSRPGTFGSNGVVRRAALHFPHVYNVSDGHGGI